MQKASAQRMRTQMQKDFHRILENARTSSDPKITMQQAIKRMLNTHKADLDRAQKVCKFEEANLPRCSMKVMADKPYCQTHSAVVESKLTEFRQFEHSNTQNSDKLFHLARNLMVPALEQVLDKRQISARANINNVEEVRSKFLKNFKKKIII